MPGNTETAKLLSAIDEIRKNVRSSATKKKGKPLSELVDQIIASLHESNIVLTYSMHDQEVMRWDAECFVFSSDMQYTFTAKDNMAMVNADWFVTGSGISPELALSNALLGAKERFLLYYFDVPKKDLDPASIIKQERFEIEEQRNKEMRSVLDKMHTKIRERVFRDPDFQKIVDETTKEFVRVNGRPSTNYYEIKTLETAEALSRAIDKLLDV